MQLHPDYINWSKEIELLTEKALIGLGKSKSDIAYVNFINDMDINDIVLIKRGATPLALVKVIGSYEDIGTNNEDKLDWFRYRRNIEILSTNTKDLSAFPLPRKTLQKAINEYTLSYKYIDNWYKNYNDNEKQDVGLKLYSIKINNYKVFNDFKIDFLDEKQKPFPLIVIVGKNGTGKTTLFDYIYEEHLLRINAFIGDSNDCIKVVENGNLKVLNNKAKKERKKIDEYLEEQSELHASNGTISYNGKSLYLGNLKENIIYLKAGIVQNEEVKKLEQLFLKYVDYFIYDKSLTAKDGYNFLKEDFNAIFKDFKLGFEFNNIDYKNKKPTFVNTNLNTIEKVSFGLSSLSTGEKTLLSKIFYLYLEQPKNKVILIDEPELSLHPSWQNKILGIYESFAKINNNQIIIATHSPHILGGVETKAIKLLTIDGDKIKVIDNFMQGFGLEFQDILIDIMGMDKLRTPVVDESIKNIKAMIANDEFTTNIFKEKWKQLESYLGADDLTLRLLKIEIVRRKKCLK
jgi:predicted ATP-binding protein involved in virulence